jgi:hypothetical protein
MAVTPRGIVIVLGHGFECWAVARLASDEGSARARATTGGLNCHVSDPNRLGREGTAVVAFRQPNDLYG